MADVPVFHDPHCNSRRNAVAIAEAVGVAFGVVRYLKPAPDAEALRSIVAKLEDPVTNLVRRDSLWAKLGLSDADAATEEQAIDLLVRHKQLLQRPLVVTPAKAIVGRPKKRVRELLTAL